MNDMTEIQVEEAVTVAVKAEAVKAEAPAVHVSAPLASHVSYDQYCRLPGEDRQRYQEVCYCTPSRGFFLTGAA